MSVYVVTGGVNGIGKATVEVLRAQGDTVYVIDNEGGDIIADLGCRSGREEAVRRVKELCPDGIDGLACIAGICFPKPDNMSILSVNYFGTVEVCDGLFDLLAKKNGSCVVTTSGSLLWTDSEDHPNLAGLLTDCGDEERIARLVNTLSFEQGYNMYGTSKLAVLRWMRRHSIEWGARGVRLNAVGPGCIDTRLGNAPPGAKVNESFHMTIPTHYHDLSIIPPADIGEVFAFLLSKKAAGMNGSIIWADGGQESYYHTERVH